MLQVKPNFQEKGNIWKKN